MLRSLVGSEMCIRDRVKADHADMVILDVNLPDMDGREACKLMRRNGYKLSLIHI